MQTRCSLLLFLTLPLVLVGASSIGVWKAKRQYMLNRQLIAALINNDRKQALALANAGADPNTRFIPLPAPTLRSLLNQFLRRSPASADTTTTAFMFACGAPYSTVEDGSIISSLYWDEMPLVHSMLAHGADCSATDKDHQSALHYAVCKNHTKTVELLLAHGVNINIQTTAGITPLMRAVDYNYVNMTRLLLEHGANVALVDEMCQTALDRAVIYRQDKECIRLLMAHGADPTHADNNNNTAIWFADKQGRPDIGELLQRTR